MHLKPTIAYRKNTQHDKPYEDAVAYDADSNVFCVTDGVTRSRTKTGTYPNPSLAAIAAAIAAKHLGGHWVFRRPNLISEALFSMRKRFAAANASIAELASEFPNPHLLGDDLPGCVATAVVLSGSMIVYGHIGDTVLVRLSKAGEMWLTTDQTAGVERWVRYHSYLDRSQQLLIIRRQFRNVIGFPESFGVLTGERKALSFVEYNVAPVQKGDRLLLFSDGVTSLFRRECKSPHVRRTVWRALARGDLDQVLEIAERLALRHRRTSDDKTLVSIEVN